MSLYKEAANLLKLTKEKKGSVKGLVLASNFQNKKALFALVCQTLKYQSVLQTILQESGIQKQHKALKDTNLALLLLYDFLLGKGLASAGKLKSVILKHKAALHAELARLKVKAKVTRNEDLLANSVREHAQLPRYVRVNLLKTSVEEVTEHFRREGYTLQYPSTDYSRFVKMIRELEQKQFLRDIHIPELLVFAAGTDLHDHILYRSGDIILQDKASCLPAFVLTPPPGSHVVDCCAAPGNKTSHAAAIMKNKGKVFAFDKDSKRLMTMNTLALKAGVLCAVTQVADFLTIRPQESKYKDVQYGIVDPSCSGSGIVSRMNDATNDADSSSVARLKQLAGFQISILKHALSFPSMRRVVYSTCSVHDEENEAVVDQVLHSVGDEFTLVDIMPGFASRGSEKFACGPKCIRLSVEKDMTNGFFVACFERKSKDVKGKRKHSSKEGIDLDNVQLAESVSSAENSAGAQPSRSDEKKKKRKVPSKLTPVNSEKQGLYTAHGGTASSEGQTKSNFPGRPNRKRKQRKRHHKHKPVTS